jgi:hypothetical protein
VPLSGRGAVPRAQLEKPPHEVMHIALEENMPVVVCKGSVPDSEQRGERERMLMNQGFLLRSNARLVVLQSDLNGAARQLDRINIILLKLGLCRSTFQGYKNPALAWGRGWTQEFLTPNLPGHPHLPTLCGRAVLKSWMRMG